MATLVTCLIISHLMMFCWGYKRALMWVRKNGWA